MEAFKTDVFVVFIFAVEAFNTDVFIVESNELFIKVFTHSVVGILEELSVLDKNDIIFGLYKKVAFDTFRTDVFVVVACIVPIVPVVDCRVLMVPEVACKLLIIPVEALKTDTFPVVACKLLIVAVEALKSDTFPVVACRLFIVPTVDCKLIKEPVDAFNTDAFVIVDCIVEALKNEVFKFVANAFDTKVFTHDVVGILEELSELDKKDIIIGFFKKNALETFKTETFSVSTSRVFIVPVIACMVEAFKRETFPDVDCRLLIVPLVDCRVVMVPEVACKLLIVAVEALKTDTFPVVD